MFTRKIEHLITCDAHGCAEQLAPSSEGALVLAANIDEKNYDVVPEVLKAFAKGAGWLSTGSDRAWRCPACAKRGGCDGQVNG